jgi:beta-1,4-mannosyltransferase
MPGMQIHPQMSAIQPLPEPEFLPLPEAPLRVLAWPIDPANPYTTSLYAQMGPHVHVDKFSPGELIHRYDVWHVHWPEALLNIRNPALATFKISAFLAMIDLVRLRGGKIVWTVHNLRAHDALHPVLEARFWRRLILRVDGLISLSETGLAMARERFPRLRRLPAAVIPHGHYRDLYPSCTVDARAELDIAANARVILFFGEVRGYKNVDGLLRAFRDVEASNAVLLIAGSPSDASLSKSIAKQAALDGRVRLALRFIERDRVARFFAAADLVVLPYRLILNSGSALLALSFNRPVLLPDLGSMGDLKNDFGSDWVNTFSSNLDAAELEHALDWAALPRSPICPMPEKYRWKSIRAETARLYQLVIARSQ